MSTNRVSVPHDRSFEVIRSHGQQWLEHLQAGMIREIQASDPDLWHLEEEIMHQSLEMQRAMLEQGAQQKADKTPLKCPKCGHLLSRVTHRHKRTFQSRFGLIRLRRARGWCKKCRRWFYPADHQLRLEEGGRATPRVQKMAALVGSKMPVGEASAVIERLSGVKLSRATLDRQARRQGLRAEQKRRELDAKVASGQGVDQQAKELQMQLLLEPFTLVIEIDAWNIRERDEWGKTKQKRAQGEEPSRWHWVYGGPCFRLSQRVETARGRPMVLSRGTVMTHAVIEGLREQLSTCSPPRIRTCI